MTGVERNPSLTPDTALPSQNDMLAAAGADASDGPTPPAAAAPGVASMEEVESFPPRADGRPRPQIVVRPRPDLLTDPPDEAALSGADPAEHSRLPQPAIEDRGTKSAGPSVPEDVDPVDQLVEFVFPNRSFTDWLLADPRSRWQLFGQAIAKDRAGVDAAFARARAVGYRAGKFTESLKTLVGVGTANAAIAHTAATTESGGRDVQPFDGGALARRLPTPREPRLSPIPPLGNWPSAKPLESPGSAARPPASADSDPDDDYIDISATIAEDPDAVGQKGRISGDEAADFAVVSGQRYAQRITKRNLAITGDRELDALTDRFLSVLEKNAKKWAALRKTVKKFGVRANAIFGTLVHYEFGKEIEELEISGKIRGVQVEQSFNPNLKIIIDYGLEGSIRTDVIKVRRGNRVVAVWDLKTGGAVLRPSRARELAEATGVPLKHVIELNYRSLTGLRRW